jgi:hypothetical protein
MNEIWHEYATWWSDMDMLYKVQKAEQSPVIDAEWNAPAWAGTVPAVVQNHVGVVSDHSPLTQARLTYDDEALYALFRVEDKYVRAVSTGRFGNVCDDSCVEFFFTPGTDVSVGYFNVEVNCGGIMLCRFQEVPRGEYVQLSTARIPIAHSLPTSVDPEIREPTTWTVAYRIPFDVLDMHCSFDAPEPGVVWRANFYKCADKSSHPHWLAWAPIDTSKPDFHRPDSFGKILFE